MKLINISIHQLYFLNKNDQTKRQIDTNTARQKAQELDCGFEEISVMDSTNEDIRQIFTNLYRGVRAQEKRTKINTHIKLTQVNEFSDPRKNPHSSPTLIRKPNVDERINQNLKCRKSRSPNSNSQIKSYSLTPQTKFQI